MFFPVAILGYVPPHVAHSGHVSHTPRARRTHRFPHLHAEDTSPAVMTGLSRQPINGGDASGRRGGDVGAEEAVTEVRRYCHCRGLGSAVRVGRGSDIGVCHQRYLGQGSARSISSNLNAPRVCAMFQHCVHFYAGPDFKLIAACDAESRV